MNSIALNQAGVNPQILIIRTYDHKGAWSIETVLKGGAVVVVPADVNEVNALESELAEQDNWRVRPSLYSNGFSARRIEVSPEADPIPFSGQPCYSYAD